MQLSQKFLFERDFDLEKARQQRVAEEAEQQAATPPPPMFDEDTLLAAQRDAYNQGFAAGKAEAESSQQHIQLGLLDRIGHSLQHVLSAEQDRLHQMQDLALRTAFYMVKKFWPRFQAKSGLQEMEQFIAAQLAQNNEETRLVLRVHDSQLDPIATQLPRLKELQGFTGKVITLADDTVAPFDCKIEWADGGAEKLGRHTLDQLEHLIERLLQDPGELPATATDSPALSPDHPTQPEQGEEDQS